MAMSRDQNAGQINISKLGNKSFERMEQFRYLETTLNNQIVFRKKLRAE